LTSIDSGKLIIDNRILQFSLQRNTKDKKNKYKIKYKNNW